MTDSDEILILFYKPCPPLQPYIRYHYVIKSLKQFNTLTFPIGCPQIIFHKRSPLFIPELNSAQSVFTISGQVNFPAHVRSDGNTEMIVTVFHPHTIGTFIGTPPISFYNLEISGYDIENRHINDLASRIFDCKDNAHCVRMIENWMLAKLQHAADPNFYRIHTTVKRLMEVPSTPIAELARIACFSKKQFERVFSQCVGMKPKEYSRIVRFQKSLWFMQNGPCDNMDIAYSNGYADESHFIREFKTFSGYTPQRLKDKCLPYSDLFTHPV